MKSMKHRVAIATVMFAIAASAFGARAADPSDYFEQQRQITDGYVAPPSAAEREAVTGTVAPAESAQFEAFERRWGQGDWTDLQAPSPQAASAQIQSNDTDSPQ